MQKHYIKWVSGSSAPNSSSVMSHKSYFRTHNMDLYSSYTLSTVLVSLSAVSVTHVNRGAEAGDPPPDVLLTDQ